MRGGGVDGSLLQSNTTLMVATSVPPGAAGYARGMAADPERYARARALFDELAALPGAERDGALAARGDVDPAVRAQVAAWLAADDGNDEDATAPGPIAALRGQWQAERAAQAPTAWVGRRIGQFELVRAIGQGGMGTVWLGERRDGAFVQRVAVKLLDAAHDPDGELLRRFRTERELLAALDHALFEPRKEARGRRRERLRGRVRGALRVRGEVLRRAVLTGEVGSGGASRGRIVASRAEAWAGAGVEIVRSGGVVGGCRAGVGDVGGIALGVGGPAARCGDRGR